MDPSDLQGDVTLTGDQIAAFCDLLDRIGSKQTFDVQKLRAAQRITRHGSLKQTEWRVTYPDKRTMVVPIAGI